MARSGYIDDIDQKDLAMWRGRVASAIRGNRGQELLRDLRDALDAMPEKRLIDDQLIRDDEVCALGAVGCHRDISEIGKLDPENHEALAEAFNVSPCLIQEIEWVNDEAGFDDTREKRWKRVRRWVEDNIKEKK